MNVPTGYIDICGSKLYFEVCGEGPAVVLIHGNMLDLRMWDFNRFELAQAGWQVVSYDMRGFGRSGRRGSETGAAVSDLLALLDALNIETAMICGSSMGGVAAMNFALEHPDRTDGLALVGSDLSQFPLSAEFADPILRTHRALLHGDTNQAMEIWLSHPMLARVRQRPAADELLLKIVGEYSWSDWLKGRAYLIDPPAFGRLGEIACPTLIITGEGDLGRFHAIADHLHREIPNSRHVTIDDASHLPNMEQPERFNEMLIEFLMPLSAVEEAEKH